MVEKTYNPKNNNLSYLLAGAIALSSTGCDMHLVAG